jgi:hypothetical protein
VEAAAPIPASLPAGTRFGDFVAVRPLAAGGMAELYLAARRTAAGPPELAAVKRMLPHLGWDPEFVRMFLEEVRIAASLRHPNIVRVVDFGVGEGGHYLAMEYLHGRTLRAVQRSIREAGPLPLAFSVAVVIEVALGLHGAHEHRDHEGNPVEVVHRDVSPSNVMVTFDGSVKLLDFGIARVTEHTQQTRAGTLKGKVGYMSPEQCRGERVDRRSDVFGLGILLYELSVGRRAFYADNDYAVIGKVVDGDYARPGRLHAGFPPALEAVIARALEVEPERRYPSAAAMVEDLQRFAAAAGLDVGPAARVATMAHRFGFEPPPVIDLAALVPGRRSATPAARPASPLRWVALASVGAAIGAAGFFVGGLARDGTAAATLPASAPAPVGAAAPTTEPVPPPRGAAREPTEAAGANAGADALEAAATADPLDANPLAKGDAEDGDDDATEPSRSGRTRRRTKPKPGDAGDPKGDPNLLLPPSWRDRRP